MSEEESSEDEDNVTSHKDIHLEHFSKTHDLWVYDSTVTRCFPYTEYPMGIPTISFKDNLLGKRKWDEYGVIIDTSKYENKGLLPTVLEEDEEDYVEEILYVPSKQEEREYKANGQFYFLFVDMQGLSDGNSMMEIYNQLEPKKLLLVHGPTKHIEELSTDLPNTEIMPVSKNWVEITSAGNVINVFFNNLDQINRRIDG